MRGDSDSRRPAESGAEREAPGEGARHQSAHSVGRG